MFRRNNEAELDKWAAKKERKPLVVRGARQVGKTTAVNLFAQKFDSYIYLNLESIEDREPFLQFKDVDTLLQAIFFLKNKVRNPEQKTLIFIDEIQEVPEALHILRFFYEQYKDIYVIAAGSLLETLFDTHISFPVGRVEYMVVRPVSFPEFLGALGENAALQQLSQYPLKDFAKEKLMSLFHTYALLGGMPEVIKYYSETKDLTGLRQIYESLIISYLDDVEKYAGTMVRRDIVRHAIRASFTEAGKRIKFEGFGRSNYGSREMGEALRTLEKALLIYLVYPNTQTHLPLVPDLRKSPRLQILDTGLMNYFLGVQQEIIATADLNKVYQGTLIEHLIGQELLATQFNALSSLNFWVNEKKSSMAEVDFIYPFDNKLIPIEVKSGAEGALRSLHIFMDQVPHKMAVRFYAGNLHISQIVTSKGKQYHLLNLPYCLASQIDGYLKWFASEITK